MPASTQLLAGGFTDRGRKRQRNEDRLHIDADRGIFLVVDGLGGHNAGETAAVIAIETIRGRLERQTGNASERLREAITLANNEILRRAASDERLAGMACVVTAAIAENGVVTVGHVGDSRLYLLHSGQIRKITSDHSPVGEREDRGDLSEAEAMKHPRRNEVFRDVGSMEHAPDDPEFIEIVPLQFPPDAALLLCSDGLSDQVSSGEIQRIVEENAGRPERAARELADAANAAGGKDNVTVVVVEGAQFAASAASHPKRAESRTEAGRQASRSNVVLFAGLIVGLLLGGVLVYFMLRGQQVDDPDTGRTPMTLIVGTTGLETIDGALERAQPGDTIMVPRGTYPGPVRLRDGVSLISSAPGEAVIQTEDAAGIGVIAENVSNARFAAFKITGVTGKPLLVGIQVTDSKLEIVDNEVTGASVAGIEIRGSSETVLRANRLVNNTGSGVIIRDYAAPRLAHNYICNNGKVRRAEKPGVEIRDSARPVLVGNIIANNGAEPVWAPASLAPEISRQNYFTNGGPPPRRAVRVQP